jgi:hypothetical protein
MWIILTAYGCEQGNGSTQGLMISKLRLEPFPEKGMALSLISHETIDLPRDHSIPRRGEFFRGETFLAPTPARPVGH